MLGTAAYSAYPLGVGATVLVIFAETAGMPTAVSTGNVNSVLPPATALTAPAGHATPPTAASCTDVSSTKRRDR